MSWQDQIEEQLEQIKSAAVLVGPAAIGPWQDREIKAVLIKFTESRRPVIPVLLPGASEEPELPLFLQDYQYVDLRRIDPDPIAQLEWGITGKHPDRE